MRQRPADAKLAVVLEGKADGSGTGWCGVTSDVVLIPFENCDIFPSATSTFPFNMSYLLAHELTHLLGAVPSCAPNATPGGGHVSDDPRDVR